MPAGTFVTTGHTSGSAGAGTTACPVADGASRLPALMAVNALPRNVRRFIMSGLPSRQGRQKFNNMAGGLGQGQGCQNSGNLSIRDEREFRFRWPRFEPRKLTLGELCYHGSIFREGPDRPSGDATKMQRKIAGACARALFPLPGYLGPSGQDFSILAHATASLRMLPPMCRRCYAMRAVGRPLPSDLGTSRTKKRAVACANQIEVPERHDCARAWSAPCPT